MSTVEAHAADVAIVRAGFAGLTAACRVLDRGHTAVVLEARDRIGGRTETVPVATPVTDTEQTGPAAGALMPAGTSGMVGRPTPRGTREAACREPTT